MAGETALAGAPGTSPCSNHGLWAALAVMDEEERGRSADRTVDRSLHKL